MSFIGVLLAMMAVCALVVLLADTKSFSRRARVFHSDASTTAIVSLSNTASFGSKVANNKTPYENYQLAFAESLGFFDDIPAMDWELMRNITLKRVNYHPNAANNPLFLADQPNKWYQRNWDPDFSCRHRIKIGVGDGGKWVCDPHRLRAQSQRRKEDNTNSMTAAGCLVYSVGSNGDFTFEEALSDLFGPGVCEIHTFDGGDYQRVVPQGKQIYYHRWGLKPSYNEQRQTSAGRFGGHQDYGTRPFKTLEETMKELGHENRAIDIFKIDCEGCEWLTYKDWLKADLRQIMVEVHAVPPIAHDFFTDLQKAGYVTFHKEPNIAFGFGRCVEYAMLKLNRTYVETRSAGKAAAA